MLKFYIYYNNTLTKNKIRYFDYTIFFGYDIVPMYYSLPISK